MSILAKTKENTPKTRKKYQVEEALFYIWLVRGATPCPTVSYATG